MAHCKNCGGLFEPSLTRKDRKPQLYCSKTCVLEHNRPKVIKPKPNRECSWCSTPIYRTPSRIRKSKTGLFFCSVQCKDKAASIKNGLPDVWPEHYGTSTGEWSYRDLVDIEKCETCGWDNRPEVLQVHHIDRDRKNNNTDNLKVLCPNCHAIEHYDNCDGLYHSKKKQT